MLLLLLLKFGFVSRSNPEPGNRGETCVVEVFVSKQPMTFCFLRRSSHRISCSHSQKSAESKYQSATTLLTHQETMQVASLGPECSQEKPGSESNGGHLIHRKWKMLLNQLSRWILLYLKQTAACRSAKTSCWAKTSQAYRNVHVFNIYTQPLFFFSSKEGSLFL